MNTIKPIAQIHSSLQMTLIQLPLFILRNLKPGGSHLLRITQQQP